MNVTQIKAKTPSDPDFVRGPRAAGEGGGQGPSRGTREAARRLEESGWVPPRVGRAFRSGKAGHLPQRPAGASRFVVDLCALLSFLLCPAVYMFILFMPLCSLLFFCAFFVLLSVEENLNGLMLPAGHRLMLPTAYSSSSGSSSSRSWKGSKSIAHHLFLFSSGVHEVAPEYERGLKDLATNVRSSCFLQKAAKS